MRMGSRHPTLGVGRRLLFGAGAVAGFGIPIKVQAQTPAERQDTTATTDLIKDWPQVARTAADEMLRKYGNPQEITGTRLHWEGNRPWLRSIVNKIGVEHDFPAKHTDVLEQVVSYRVPLNFFEPIATFNGSDLPP